MSHQGRSVLIVDDEFSIVETLGEILTWEGFTVRTAPNGKVALEAMRAEKPSLVLLDIMMPVMDGHQLIAAMKSDPALGDIPIVVMSAAPIRPMSNGALWNAELRKPFDVERLLAALRTVLGA